MTDTNYNDGKWHGWNGGACPVHEKTEAEVAYILGSGIARETGKAGAFTWGETEVAIIAFRVTKEHKQPREWWIAGGHAYTDFETANAQSSHIFPIVHVREVIGKST